MKNKGFTLIELIAVLVIMSIITLLATPNIISLMNKGKEDSFKSEVKTTVTKIINKHKENPDSNNSSFTDLKVIKSTFDLPDKDPYGYDYKDFRVTFQYGSSTDGEGLATPSSRTMTVDVRACKGTRCHCFGTPPGETIKQVEELDEFSVTTDNCSTG